MLVDLRNHGGPAWPKTRVRGGRTVLRDPRSVDAVCLHQTAVRLPPGKRDKDMGGPRFAPAFRAHRVAAHAVALRNGDAVLTRPARAYVHNAGPLNARIVGLEIEGRYAGICDDPKTAPREDWLSTWGLKEGEEPDTLTPLAFEGARLAIVKLVEAARADGCPIRYVFAHRQASKSRRSDPGEEIWERIALGVGERELGLEARPLDTFGDGRPIPVAWDVRGAGRY